MGIYLGSGGTQRPADDLGVMSGVETAAPKAPAAPTGGDVPAAPAAAAATDASDKPAATDKPATTDKPAATPAAKDGGKDVPKPADPEKH
jgi:hypothetical protein